MIGFYKISPKKVILALSILIAANAVPLQKDGVAIREIKKEQISYRLPDNVRPLHYGISLIPYMTEDEFTFDGEVTIDIEIEKTTLDIILHAYQLEIDENSTTLLQESDTDMEIIKPASHNYNNENQMLTLHFNESLRPNMYTLFLKFMGTLNGKLKGFYRSSYNDSNGTKMWMLTTNFEPTNARRVFPCFDEPALKATFSISIQHYDNYTALSNMPILSSTPINKTGKVWTNFETTPMMSTYLVAIVVGDLTNISSSDGINNVWAREDVIENGRLNLAVATDATKVLETYINSSFRMPKMDHVAVVQYSEGAMENWGLIIYSEKLLLYNSSQSTFQMMFVIEVAVHELAHQWFGNVVSPSWWSYTWLNEAFAAYFQRYIVDQIMDAKWMDYFVVTTQQLTLKTDCTKDIRPISINVETPSDAESAFSLIMYNKGASILRMLSHCLSEDVFRDGLIKYIDSYQYNATTPSDLWSSIQSVLNRSDVPHDEFTVAETMNTWTDQIGFPLVNVHRDYDNGRVTLTQQIFRPHYYTFGYNGDDRSGAGEQRVDVEQENYKWWIPVSYTTQTNPNFAKTLPSVWMKPHEDNTTIYGMNDSDWIILNLQQTGFYRVNYDTENWQKIGKYLNCNNYRNIHPLNRAQILDDSFNLLKAGQFDPTVYMQLTSYLFRESDIVPWIPAFRILDEIKSYILHPAVTDVFKPHILGLMSTIVKSVGFEERSDDSIMVKMHRHSVINWACMMGSSACKRIMIERTVAYLEDPKMNNIPEDLKLAVLCEGFREMNESVWGDFESEIVKRAEFDLTGINCVENKFVIKSVVDMIITQYSTKSRRDLESIISMQLPSYFPAGDVILNYILDNCKTKKNMYSTRCNICSTAVEILVRNVITKNVHTTKQLNKARALINTCGIHNYEINLYAVKSKVRKIEEEVSILQSWFQESWRQKNLHK